MDTRENRPMKEEGIRRRVSVSDFRIIRVSKFNRSIKKFSTYYVVSKKPFNN
jgi:hypothetical protein